MKRQLLQISILLLTIISFTSCQENTENADATDEGYKHLVALSLPATESYPFHLLEKVETGTADIKNSQEIPGIPNNVPITGKNGFIYLNSTQKVTKYKVDEAGILEDLGSVPNTGISGGPIYEFLSDNRLLVTSGPRATANGVFNYQIIDTENMANTSTGTITLPTDENSLSIPCGYILKEGKIYVPYIHSNQKYAAYDKAPIAIFNATTMAYEKTIYTTKAAALGYSVVSSHGFSENGDLYITACNSNYWGGNESIPSGIVRIKAGETDFDESFFFNLTEKFNGNHTGGIVYAGNNKFIVQVFRKDLITEYKDYQGGFVVEYHIVDIDANTTARLDMPLCKYPRRAFEKLPNGNVAIVSNTEHQGNLFYIYDGNTVSKGLKYEGTEFISAFFPFK